MQRPAPRRRGSPPSPARRPRRDRRRTAAHPRRPDRRGRRPGPGKPGPITALGPCWISAALSASASTPEVSLSLSAVSSAMPEPRPAADHVEPGGLLEHGQRGAPVAGERRRQPVRQPGQRVRAAPDPAARSRPAGRRRPAWRSRSWWRRRSARARHAAAGSGPPPGPAASPAWLTMAAVMAPPARAASSVRTMSGLAPDCDSETDEGALEARAWRRSASPATAAARR